VILIGLCPLGLPWQGIGPDTPPSDAYHCRLNLALLTSDGPVASPPKLRVVWAVKQAATNQRDLAVKVTDYQVQQRWEAELGRGGFAERTPLTEAGMGDVSE
jgi:hypothetical protein